MLPVLNTPFFLSHRLCSYRLDSRLLRSPVCPAPPPGHAFSNFTKRCYSQLPLRDATHHRSPFFPLVFFPSQPLSLYPILTKIASNPQPLVVPNVKGILCSRKFLLTSSDSVRCLFSCTDPGSVLKDISNTLDRPSSRMSGGGPFPLFHLTAPFFLVPLDCLPTSPIFRRPLSDCMNGNWKC